MADETTNARLNELLIRIYRSLLQYAGECWPWTAAHVEEEAIRALVAEQQQFVAALVDLLSARYWPIQFGSFPTEYTDLHYVALDYLLDEIIRDQLTLIADLEQAHASVAGDTEAVDLINDILHSQRQIVAKLQTLAAARQRAA